MMKTENNWECWDNNIIYFLKILNMKKAFILSILLLVWFTFADEIACTMDYSPVCWVDFKTYSNRCVAENQNGIKVAYPQACSVTGTAMYVQITNVLDTFFNQNASKYTWDDSKSTLLDGLSAKLNQKKKDYEKDADKYAKVLNIMDIINSYSINLTKTIDMSSTPVVSSSIMSGNFEDDVASDVVTLMVRNLRKTIGKKEHTGALMVAYNVIWQQTWDDITDYYIWALVQEYYLDKDKNMQEWAKVMTPIDVKIQKKWDYFIPISYKMPWQSNYTGDVKAIFPEKTWNNFLMTDTRTYETMLGDMMNRVYISAKEFFK